MLMKVCRRGFTTVGVKFPFMSQSGFLFNESQLLNEDAPFRIAGIAYDGATTNRPGSRFGPKAIREASHMLCDGTHPFFNISPIGHFDDIGDLDLPTTNITEMRKKLQVLAGKEISKKHMVWLGGDHSITLPLLREYRKHFDKKIAVVHFDAHCDTWTDHFSEPSGHGTWVYEAYQEGLVEPELFTQFGIRSAGEKNIINYVADQGGEIYTSRDLRGLENENQLKSILDRVTARLEKHKDVPIYLTLDIDCLDPAFAPGTGTPEVAGLSTNQVSTILETLCSKKNLNFVGMDCVEVSPPYDSSQITSLAAAQFVWTYLSARLSKK